MWIPVTNTHTHTMLLPPKDTYIAICAWYSWSILAGCSRIVGFRPLYMFHRVFMRLSDGIIATNYIACGGGAIHSTKTRAV